MPCRKQRAASGLPTCGLEQHREAHFLGILQRLLAAGQQRAARQDRHLGSLRQLAGGVLLRKHAHRVCSSGVQKGPWAPGGGLPLLPACQPPRVAGAAPAVGPMKAIPLSSHMAANSVFSDRKP